MPIRYYAQRKHIIESFDSLLYQLHTLSFFLAPGFFGYICRCATQFQFSRMREADGAQSLWFWYFLIVFVNMGSLWGHMFYIDEPDAKTLVLDFIGMSRRPTKFQLLSLDFFIMFIQAILATISFETVLIQAMPESAPDPLLPDDGSAGAAAAFPSSLPPFGDVSAQSTSSSIASPSKTPYLYTPSPSASQLYPPVIDLRFQHIRRRLSEPAQLPPPRSPSDEDLNPLGLPFPNSMIRRDRRLSRTLDLIRQFRMRRAEFEAEMRRRQDPQLGTRSGRGGRSGRRREEPGSERRPRTARMPGDIETDDVE